MPPLLPLSILSTCLAASTGAAAPCTCGVAELYAQTAWPAVHRDSRNSDFAPFVTTRSNNVAWTALDGAATLLAPTMGPEGNLYITTGQGPGTSHLHAYDRSGMLLWESAPQVDLDDLDSAAIAGAPTIDEDGDLYIDDANQLWAFESDGRVKWVTSLPEPGFWFSSPILVPTGLVGGITTNGKVALYHRDDGNLAVPVLDLPGASGPRGPDVAPGIWAGGLIDPEIIQPIFNHFFGYEYEVANTPAVHPQTGRIYITAAGETVENGVLYGIDIVDGALVIAFQAPMGPGSGTSPAISPDGSQVYAADGAGLMFAFDAYTGDQLWTSAGAASAASPTVGPDGTIYSGGGDRLLALDPNDGSLRWSRGFDDVARSWLRRRIPSRFFPTGRPVARTNSVVSVTTKYTYVVLVLGYEFQPPDTASKLLQPHLTVLASVDPGSGALTGTVVLRDTNEGVISIGSDGRMYVSHASLLSSLFYYQVDLQLPSFWRIAGPPRGGLSALRPASFEQLAKDGMKSTARAIARAVAALARKDATEAASAVSEACCQLCATINTIGTDATGEIAPETADEVGDLLPQSRGYVESAAALLQSEPAAAILQLGLARDSLEAAQRTLLGNQVIATLDVRPGVCPDTLCPKPRWLETVEVAVLGSPDLDVRLIDAATIVLSRLDGVGSGVHPTSRRFRPGSYDADVATPPGNDSCACVTAEPDGLLDRVFVFRARELAQAVELRGVPAGQELELAIQGELIDGSTLQAVGCAVVSSR